MGYNSAIIRWSKISTVIFIGLVLVADIFGVVISKYITYIWGDRTDDFSVILLAAVFYAGTLFAYVILVSLLKLLDNMSKDIVFDKKNTKLMGFIVGALVCIAAVCIVGGFVWTGSWFLSIIALFMGLVVLSVKVVFDKAIAMKEEMDLTI